MPHGKLNRAVFPKYGITPPYVRPLLPFLSNTLRGAIIAIGSRVDRLGRFTMPKRHLANPSGLGLDRPGRPRSAGGRWRNPGALPGGPATAERVGVPALLSQIPLRVIPTGMGFGDACVSPTTLGGQSYLDSVP